jgi:dihydrofolate reductase
MRKIVAGFAISLDGYMEGPNGEYDWMTATLDPGHDFSESMKRFDTFLYGRRTYEKILPAGMGGLKDFSNYVFSKTLQNPVPPFMLASGAIDDFISDLRQKQGKDIALYGGADLLASFLELDLIDEMTMTIIPVVLGSGKPAVGFLDTFKWLKIVEVKQFKRGNVQLTYEVVK